MSDDPDEPTGAGSGPDPVQAGIEQFQRAALDAIRAGRAMLDAAESVLQDPKAAESVVRTVGTVARTATEAVSGFAAGRWPGTSPAADAGDASGDVSEDEDRGGDDDPPDGFERITIV